MHEQLTLLSGEAPAKASQLPESERGSREPQGSCTNTYAAFVSSVRDGLSGRTSRERSRASEGTLSSNCSPRWMNSGTVWRGEFSTRSFSVWPNDASVCSLSEVLEPLVPAKFCLSRKACLGILRRAERRGKLLPPELDAVLRSQARGACPLSYLRKTSATKFVCLMMSQARLRQRRARIRRR